MLINSRNASAATCSGRFVLLLIAMAAMTAWPATSQAQFGRSRGGSRGGSDGGDRAERMRAFFSQMRESRGGDRGGSSDDRRARMQQFFSQMRGSRGGGDRGSSRGGSRGGSDRGRSGSSSKQAKPKPKPRMTLDLPEEYAELDRDKDGQLGLYEWKLSEIAEFRSYDVNADGFLTPRELLTGGSEDAESASSGEDGDSSRESDSRNSGDRSASTKSASTKSASTKSASTKSASTKTDTSSDKSTSTRDATTVRRAKLFFKSSDKDKDGKLTVEEWGQSRMARSYFSKNKVKVKLPIDEPGFIAIFPASKSR